MVTAEPVTRELVILEPDGRLTAETVHEFTRILSRCLRHGWHDVIVDLRFVNYLDSAGLGALAHAYLSSQRRGGRLVFANVCARNLELLRVTKLVTVFDIYGTTPDAERSFAVRVPSGSDSPASRITA